MYISRTLWCLAIIVAFSYADILDDVSTTIFGETFTEVEDKVIKTAKAIKTWYKNHRTIIEAGEMIILAETGLGEAGMIDEVYELYESGALRALWENKGDLAVEAASEVRSIAEGMFAALKSVESLPSWNTAVNIGKETIDLLDPYLDKLASSYVLEEYPLTGSQLVILLANLIGTSVSKINTPEVACKTEAILREFMKRSVNARLEKLEAPEDFDDAVTFYKEVNKIQNWKYNKNGYNSTSDNLRCDKGEYPKCFKDKFKRGGEKKTCSSWKSCYGDYAGMLRHKTEATFPIELFEKTCHNTITQDQIDGKFIILLHVLSTIYHQEKILINVFLLCR